MKKLNFGCRGKFLKGWVNVDIQKGNGVDKSFDFNEFPYPFKDNTFDYVLVDEILEHLDDPKKVLNELWRICKSNATMRIVVPYCHCLSAFNDIEHKHYFNMRTITLLVHPKRDYKLKSGGKFSIVKLDLLPTRLGKLVQPRELRNAVSKVFGNICGRVEAVLKVIK